MYIVAGIGNPGSRYQNTRHNVGFDLVDHLGDPGAWKKKGNAWEQQRILGGQKVLLAKTNSYVNLTGEALKPLAQFYQVPPEKTVIVADDVNLNLGALRIRSKGSHGGHNGLKSILQYFGDNFPRVRIGVGPCPPGWDLSHFVLGKFSKGEKKIMEETIARCAEALECGLQEGWQPAAGQYNRRTYS